jgi:hypothetical protein
VPNLTEASTNLYELVKHHNLLSYRDDDLRLAISRTVALETARGRRIAKEKASHKIDVIVALAQAALGAVQGGSQSIEFAYTPVPDTGYQLATAFRTPTGEDADRLYARGEDIAEAEDRADALARVRDRGIIEGRRGNEGCGLVERRSVRSGIMSHLLMSSWDSSDTGR